MSDEGSQASENQSPPATPKTDAPSSPPPPPPNPVGQEVAPPQQRGPNHCDRRQIAQSTLETIDHGSFEINGKTHDLRPVVDLLIEDTTFYPAESELQEWINLPARSEESSPVETEVAIEQCSTLEGCHRMHKRLQKLEGDVDRRIGVLNFASAKKPGGGFLTGAQAQEESIARSSTLYASLMINTAQQYYILHHKCVKNGYYTHAMIYSPRVQLFKLDSGELHEPIEVDILTSAAVNAGVVRNRLQANEDEGGIESAMRERMGRLLYLFEKRGVKTLILGSFGTGVFRNKVELVAKLWIELLVAEGSRFKHSFERVLFAIIDTPTVSKFTRVFSGEELSAEEEESSANESEAQLDGANLESIVEKEQHSEDNAEPRL